jgi:hypothetical protein
MDASFLILPPRHDLSLAIILRFSQNLFLLLLLLADDP